MRNNLDGLSKICAFAFLIDDCEIDFSCSDIVCFGHVHAQESFVVSEVKVSLCAIIGHIALAMLVWIQCTRVNVNVRVKFLDGDSETSGLQKFSQ